MVDNYRLGALLNTREYLKGTFIQGWITGFGGAGGVENKLKNEVKIQNFPLKVRTKPKILCLLQTT